MLWLIIMSNQQVNQVRYITVDAGYAGQRIDNFLLRELKSLPKSRIYKLIRGGEVRVNKGRIKASYHLKAGDLLRIPPVRTQVPSAAAEIGQHWLELIEQRLLFEDGDLLVINKPSGLPVHGGSQFAFGLIDILKARYPSNPHVALAHRLDKETSGCLLVAKNRLTLQHLHELFKENQVEKYYHALTQGHWQQPQRQVEYALNRNKSGHGKMQVSEDGKPSTTYFRLLRQYSDAALVEAKPISGRMHQIRVHCQAIGHVIAGDGQYGMFEFNKAMRQMGLKRLFLHAKKITLPFKGESCQFEAPLDEMLEQVLLNIE